MIINSINFIIMKLPKLAYDQSPLHKQYLQCLSTKNEPKHKQSKLIYDWMGAEISLIPKISNQQSTISQLIRFQSVIKQQQVSAFYSYFMVHSWLSTQQYLHLINQQCQAIINKQSFYHKINILIRIRQNALDIAYDLAKNRNIKVYQRINDIRFLNIQIIKCVKDWKLHLHPDAQNNAIFLYSGQNYLVKLINDNISIIESLSDWNGKFIYPPNPFFLDHQGTYQGITPSQKKDIDYCMEILAIEKAQQLKLFISPPIYIAKFYPKAEEKELKNLKHHLQIEKSSPLTSTIRYGSVRNQKRTTVFNQHPANNLLDNLIKQSEIGILKQIKSSKTKDKYSSPISSLSIQKQIQTHQHKLDSLRSKIQSNIHQKQQFKLNQPKKLPKTLSEIKTIKPKMKLIQVKDTIVDKVVKTIITPNLQMYKSQNIRRSASSFFKMDKIEQVNEDNLQTSNIKPITQQLKLQHQRAQSVSKINHSFLKTKFIPNKTVKKQQKYKNNIKSKSFSKSIQKMHHSLGPSKPNNKREKSQESILKDSKLNEIDESLRLVKSRLKELTIKRIYQHKDKIPSTRQNPYKSTESLPKKQSNIKLPQKKQKQELSFKKVHLSNQIVQKRQKINQTQINDEKRVKQQKLSVQAYQKNTDIKELEKKLVQKENKIKQLLNMLEKQSMTESRMAIKNNQIQREQFEKQKMKIKLENQMIEQKMKQQQINFLKLKQEEFKLKQAQTKKQFQLQLEKIRANYNEKSVQMQKRRQEQQKLNQKKLLQLLEQKKKVEQLKQQLEQKQIKQMLLSQLMAQKQSKQQQIIFDKKKQKQQIQNQIIMETQEKKKYLKQMEEYNRQLQERYYQIQLKNKKLIQSNQQINNKINSIVKENQISQQFKDNVIGNETIQNIMKIQQQKDVNVQKNLVSQQNKQIRLNQIKLRVKQQIIQQIIKRRKNQEQQQRKYKEERARKVKQIEQQIKNQLKKQQEQIMKMNQQMQRKRKQSTLKYEQQLLMIQKNKSQNLQQIQMPKTKQAEIKKQKQQTIIDEQLFRINNETNDKVINQQILKNYSFNNISEINNTSQKYSELPSLQQNSQKLKDSIKQNQNQTFLQKKQAKKISNLQDIHQSNIQKQLQNNIIKGQEKKIENIKQFTPVQQSKEDILDKYQNIQQYIIKCKQIFIDQSRLTDYLNNFFLQLDVQVRQMIPYSKKQLEQLLIRNKGDIFDCQSIGWIQNDKYILIGNIGCIDLIVKKYGLIQIQIKYIMTKNNPYQKQFLAKKIKQFEQIGYIYQKKLTQTLFSIKFIIKVPKHAVPPNFNKPTNRFCINSLLSIQNHNKNCPPQTYSQVSFRYLLSQTLKNNLTQQQVSDLISKNDPQSKQILNRIHQSPVTNSIIRTTQIDDSRTELQIKLSIKYVNFFENSCFVLNGYQAKISQNERMYISKINDNISILIMQSSQTDFTMDTYIETKIKLASKQRELLICFPIWSTNKTFYFNKYLQKPYLYKEHIISNFNYGSIINSSIKKQDFKLIQDPFIFAIYENNSAGIFYRVLFATVVTKQQIIIKNNS